MNVLIQKTTPLGLLINSGVIFELLKQFAYDAYINKLCAFIFKKKKKKKSVDNFKAGHGTC